jgi:cyclophilin family peptidyl-prolyl cis-trans isomerase
MASLKPADIVKDNKNALLPILAALILFGGIGYMVYRGDTELTFLVKDNTMDVYDEYPEMDLKDDLDYKAVIETNMGDIKIDLFEKDAPLAVNSFKYLTDDGFYNGLIFHRVVNDFMIQGGDPEGNGTGGAGYSFEDELNNGHDYEPGIIAMANSGPDSNSSQFFITVSTFKKEVLSSEHTVFGKVTEGMDVVDAISKVETNASDKPEESVRIDAIHVNMYYLD